MRFDLSQASYRVLERASRLRLQRGIAAISFAKLLWALFEEDECRAACWLHEAGLSLEQFQNAFGFQTLQSPISAPSFPVGSYGISAGQYTPPAPPSPDLESTRTGNNAPSVGNPYPDPLPPDESEHEPPDTFDDQPQDNWEPSEQQKYSLYSSRQKERKPTSQSRLQFYLDDQWVNVGLPTTELEDTLNTIVQRFIRSDHRQPISVSGGIKHIALGTLSFALSTEHLLLAVVLDTGDVGRWLRENGFEPAELYQRIDGETADGRQQTAEEDVGESVVSPTGGLMPAALDCHLPSAICRLLDAAANRGREAIRVIEDYVRFILDDADLTQRLKTFRHQLQDAVQQFPMQHRLEVRNTEYDVGTDISVAGEYERPTIADLLSANFSRLQESLRSLEEFSKLSDPLIAQQFEQLRYQSYTLHKNVGWEKSGGHKPPGDAAANDEGISHLPLEEGCSVVQSEDSMNFNTIES